MCTFRTMNSKRKLFLRRAILSARLLRLVPFVRLIALNGSLVRGRENENSDIDFLIIAKAGRLYTARFFSIVVIALTTWRRSDQDANPAGKICLNCFLNSIDPDISPKNPKSRRKVAESNKHLVTLVDRGGYEQKFLSRNKWMDRFAVDGEDYSNKLRKKLVPRGPSKPINLFEPILSGCIGDFIERKLMNYQIKRIKRGVRRGDETLATIDEVRLHPRKSNKR